MPILLALACCSRSVPSLQLTVAPMTDRVHCQQIAGLPGLVVSAARFADFSFGRHVHLDYPIGLVNEGVQHQQARILPSAA